MGGVLSNPSAEVPEDAGGPRPMACEGVDACGSKASGEEMEKLSGSSSTVKGAFAGAGSAIQCLDLLRCFRAYTIPLHFRSLGKGMHEYLWW